MSAGKSPRSADRHECGDWQPSGEMIRARRVVAEAFGVTDADVMSGSRKQPVAHARQAAAFVLRAVWPALSYPCLAKVCGRSDHSTVIHAVKAVRQRMEASADLAARIEGLVVLLTSKADLRDHNAHVRAWQIALIDSASARRADARCALEAGSAASEMGKNYHEVVARGVASVNAARRVKPANALAPDDGDALRRKVGADGLAAAIAAAGGWPTMRANAAKVAA